MPPPSHHGYSSTLLFPSPTVDAPAILLWPLLPSPIAIAPPCHGCPSFPLPLDPIVLPRSRPINRGENVCGGVRGERVGGVTSAGEGRRRAKEEWGGVASAAGKGGISHNHNRIFGRTVDPAVGGHFQWSLRSYLTRLPTAGVILFFIFLKIINLTILITTQIKV